MSDAVNSLDLKEKVQEVKNGFMSGPCFTEAQKKAIEAFPEIPEDARALLPDVGAVIYCLVQFARQFTDEGYFVDFDPHHGCALSCDRAFCSGRN